MERFQQPPRQRAEQATPPRQDAATAENAASAATVNPLSRIQGWVSDMGLFGLAFGVPMGILFALDTTNTIGAGLLAALSVPPACALMGALSGLLGGIALRLLRGRVPAGPGLMLAALAANLPWIYIAVADAGSLATVLSWLLLWMLAVTASIPVSAVRRSQGRSSARWNIGAGLLIGLAAVAVRLAAMQLGIIL